MPEIDNLAESRNYFRQAGWAGGTVNHRILAKAVKALGGELVIVWS